ncbi:hypothetical protein LIER_40531 [Lithospermum erythrorhizon]|uniref:Tf2-1-like SH3-like domain-containing protein n=1 Tax=Lithospermum erythrorhizon TaxID=34254 RepID=A0AAV3QXH1_LITER
MDKLKGESMHGNILRCMCSDRPQDWCKWLSLAEYWYNRNYHSSLKKSPFEALYGYKPPLLAGTPYLKEVQIEAKDMVAQRRQLAELIKSNLTLAQQRMKKFADLNKSYRSFEIGELVYLKLQPYTQNTISLRKNLKIVAKFYGPFEIFEKIGNVTYKL